MLEVMRLAYGAICKGSPPCRGVHVSELEVVVRYLEASIGIGRA